MSFTGTVASLDYGTEFAGTTLAGDWQDYFDEYDWQKETSLGKQYQGALGGLFEKAGTGTMDLMSSWAGGGQTLSGRKLGQRKALGKGTAYDAFKLGQGLDIGRFTARTAWERDQRSNLNTMLGWDIYGEGSGLGTSGGQESWEEENQVTCCDGSTVIMATQCGSGNMPWECGDTGNEGGGSPPTEPTDPCPDQYQCPDGTCVDSQFECLG